ncbi:glucocorticoid modulatory element-binding protein 2 isoform B [Patagioenas fasciata monilis]|uniref:Glucocorticoid modulatory element-binding protein 2 isoform B n=1 Tax=Patagioenas fasciata monilis TaxID=372326 RepID=A0A1V4KKQ1_PATFA|nr:glucocorticoid modulatory element-binding protein 2 isoform B [Patagioenas fasciata monilis]
MAEDEDSLEAEIVYPITCGDSKANLIWRKFVCPGINVKCVQVRIKSLTLGSWFGWALVGCFASEPYCDGTGGDSCCTSYLSSWPYCVVLAGEMLPEFNCTIGEVEKFGHFQCLLSLKVENLLRSSLVETC